MDRLLILWCTFLLSRIGHTQGICTWPGSFANTVWRDGVQGDLSFTSQTMSGWDLVTSTKTITSWQCHSTDWFESDSFLILRSTEQLRLYDKDLYGYLCLYIIPVTGVSFRYFIYNPQQVNLDNSDRLLIDFSADLQDFDLLCSNNTARLTQRPAVSEYRVMINSGNEAAAKINCPYLFLGNYDYTHTDSTGSETCAGSTDVMDTCTDFSDISFSYDTCSTRIAYSTSNTVWCVDAVPVNDNNYVTIYNGNDNTVDGTTTFRFTCIAISGDGTTASVSPNNCKKDQAPDALPSGSSAATLELTKTGSCESCPRLAAPDGGNVTYYTDGAVTTATYQCSEQYSLAGSSTRECQADLTWTLEAPTCTCILPSVPAKGSVVFSSDGSTITYSCDAGYVLVGTETRSCQSSSNTWTGSEPTCDLCDVITLTSGLNSSQDAQGTTTVTDFTCAAGYTLSGAPNSTCQTDGGWDPAIPSCAQCQSITFPSSGSMSVTTDGFSSTATFTCVSSYSLVGSATLTCDTVGAWSDDMPSCYCDNPPSIDNGTMTANGINVTYACDAGFNMNGLSTRTCLGDGSGWSDVSPSCEFCGSITSSIEKYYNLSTDGETTLATFSCISGYTLTGERTVTCQPGAGAGWTVTHTCVPCASLTAPSSGNVTIATNGTTSVATYSCSSGYSMAGESTSVCRTDGAWLSDAPTCYCSPVSAIDNGQIISDDGQEAYYQCDLGYTLDGSSVRICSNTGAGWSNQDPTCVPCPSLVVTEGGNSTLQTDGTVTRAGFTCDVGYTISGKTTLTCQTDGTWDNTQPTCALCETLQDPTGGNVTLFSDGNTVTKATYSCGVGYTLSGSSLLTCDDTGQWDLSPPTCSKCTTRAALSSGNIDFTSDGQTTTATYSCATGYSLVGQSTITCRTDGNWNAPSPSCDCEVPAAPINGSVSVTDDNVVYSCDVGFTLSGDSTGTCQTDGTGWDIRTPSCATCDFVSNITDGNLTLITDGTTTQAVYTCELGGTLLGTATVTCNTSGSWEVEQPQCVTCPTLSPVSSGVANVTSDGTTTGAVYSCSYGYYVSGSPQLTCTTSGNWSDAEPQCLCDPPSIQSGGSYNISEDGQTISYSCDAGYSIDGTENITCATDGTGWSISQPTCVECPALTDPVGGTVTMVTSGTQSQAQYSCNLGYTMDGESYSVCQTDGTWNASVPTCVQCPGLVNITSGTLTLTSDGLTTTGSYACSNQYELSGSSLVACTNNGTWDQSPPSCYCVVPSSPVNGNVTVSTDRSTLTYTCDAGYILDGTGTRTCQSSGLGWTDSTPSCVSCSDLAPPSNGTVALTTDGSVTIATYQCDPSYSMNGDTAITCQSDGTWAGQIPICVQCPSLTDPSSGTVTLATDGVNPTANYTCMSGYYMIGQSYTTCNSSGIWSSAEPVCVCDPVSNPTNGNTSYSDSNNTISYSCDLGYSIAGPVTRTCGTDGSGWDGTDPTCVTCPDVTETADSNYTVVSDGTVTSVQYKCDQGTSLSGTATLECQSDGTWSGSKPECVMCPALSSPDSGNVTVFTDGVTTTATYVCAAGYETVDSMDVIECQIDGTWSLVEPTCNCIPPSSPTNGHLALTDNNSTMTYTCDLLYTLVGDHVRVCQQGGAGWNGTDPTCFKCVDMTAPTNGSISTNTTGSQSFASFMCDLGTTLSGEPVSYCQSDGSWSSSEPSCVSCPTTTNPDSGSVSMATNGTVTKATYSCTAGYYVDGNSVLTCSDSGQWDSTIPTCACSISGAINHGAVISNGQTASFTCNLGYSVDGATSSTCQSNGGGWDNPTPTCTKCTDFVTPTNGSVKLGTNGTVTTADFLCEAGTTMDGSQHLTCASDGSWDSATPSCVVCDSLGSPANGQFTLSTDGTTTTVTLECVSGYEATGIISVNCKSDGTWTSQGQGYCEKVEDDSKTVSFLTALIIVSVMSALIITVLAILLGILLRLYRRKKNDMLYSIGLAETANTSYFRNGNISQLDDEPPFIIPNRKVTPSIAPANHERHVLDMREGSFVVSPAPSGHGMHITENSMSPRSSAPLETERSMSSVTSFDSSNSSQMLKSLASLSSVGILPNPNRLRPLSGHQKLMEKIQKSTTPKSLTPDPSPKPVRSTTPVSHSISSAPAGNDLTMSDVSN